MKSVLPFLFLILIWGSPFVVEFQKSEGIVKIGEFANGGIVFWVDSTGQHGLVCTKIDLARSIRWNDGLNKINTTITDDNDNKKVKESLTDDEFNRVNQIENLAAKVCSDYSVREEGVLYDDWYLPSREELHLMYISKAVIDSTAILNGGTRFLINNELSPIEYCNSPAWDQVFNYGYLNYDYKNSIFNVRAIRAF